jgi:hypothetical protein
VWYHLAIASTSGRLHSEFVRLLFLQAHRETDRFFAASGVHLAQTQRGMFHFRRLPSRGVLGSNKSESWQHPRHGCSFTYQLKY